MVLSPAETAMTEPHRKAPLYVDDLDPAVGEGDLSAAFAEIGESPVSVHLCRDRLSGASVRYAYLNFSSAAEADRAMKFMNHTVLKGRPMRIMWSARNPIARENGNGNLFVK